MPPTIRRGQAVAKRTIQRQNRHAPLRDNAQYDNPKPASRTHSVAVAVADAVAAAFKEPADRVVIDLADHAPRLFDWSDPELTRLTNEVAAADVAIFASPAYKASYTGLLKAFLDRYGNNGLVGVTAVKG